MSFPSDQMFEQNAFSRSAFTQDDQNLAPFYLQVDVFKHPLIIKRFVQMLHPDHGRFPLSKYRNWFFPYLV